MKAMVLLAVIVCAFAGTQPLVAQENRTDGSASRTIGEELKSQTFFGVGLQAGLLSGSGLTARIHFPNRIGTQAAFGIIKFGDNLYWSAGAEFQYSFNSNADDHFYGLIGGGYYYASTDEDDISSGNELESPVRLGFGVGYEWFASRNLVWNITLPFTFFTGNKSTILPLPQLALAYYFQ